MGHIFLSLGILFGILPIPVLKSGLRFRDVISMTTKCGKPDKSVNQHQLISINSHGHHLPSEVWECGSGVFTFYFKDGYIIDNCTSNKVIKCLLSLSQQVLCTLDNKYYVWSSIRYIGQLFSNWNPED